MSIFEKDLSIFEKDLSIFEKDLSIFEKDLSIFEKDSFTLKELCKLLFNLKKNSYTNEINFINEIDYINDIILCYIYFSSGNNYYRTFLNNTRNNKGFIYIDSKNNKKLIFRELLQIFDFEFNKLVIRIKTECKNYDINITWNDFEEKTKNISKLEFKEFIKNN